MRLKKVNLSRKRSFQEKIEIARTKWIVNFMLEKADKMIRDNPQGPNYEAVIIRNLALEVEDYFRPMAIR